MIFMFLMSVSVMVNHPHMPHGVYNNIILHECSIGQENHFTDGDHHTYQGLNKSNHHIIA